MIIIKLLFIYSQLYRCYLYCVNYKRVIYRVLFICYIISIIYNISGVLHNYEFKQHFALLFYLNCDFPSINKIAYLTNRLLLENFFTRYKTMVKKNLRCWDPRNRIQRRKMWPMTIILRAISCIHPQMKLSGSIYLGKD